MADRNSDGRLSVREMREMVKLLDKLDRDGDGKLALNEIPREYRGSFELGGGGGGNFGRVVVAPGVTPFGIPGPPKAGRGPLWFRKMDRNGDGDVSRKEFLGTDEQFRAIDTDGDGLISVEEAEAYDKLIRAKEKD
jgi:Ca2+-binding EF-hand superfamily protein